MARVDVDPEDRDRGSLLLAQLLTCPACEVVFDHVFTAPAGVIDEQDLVESVVESLRCPSCDCPFEARYDGWIAHEDAG